MQNKPGVLCMPEGSMVDTISSPKFSDSNERFFEDYENWKFLWKTSILVAILKRYLGERCIDVLSSLCADKMPSEIRELFNLGYTRVSEYFNYIIRCPRKVTNIIFQNFYIIDAASNEIRSSVCVFIDKVDQALSNQTHEIIGQSKMSTGPRNASFWQYAQLALADVSYEILAKNQHIKVYYSIRSEAFVDAMQISYNFQNMQEYYCILEYSREELREMFLQYIRFEKDENLYDPALKNTNPTKAFVGIDEIACKYIKNTTEPVFDYILRHTFLRPRDIMDICYHLYAANLKLVARKELENKIREVVNRESQVNLETYITNTEKLLLGIEREHIEYLCQLLNVNVMNKAYLKYVCRRLNEYFQEDGICDCDNNCDTCEKLHPFCQLSNIGLIGYLWENRADICSVRFFSQNDGLIFNNNHILPNAKYYFLHPCLASKAEHIRKSRAKNDAGFVFIRNILVKHGAEIKKGSRPHINKKINEALKQIKSERVFISSTCYDLGDERKQIDATLSELGYDVVRSDAANFNSNSNGVHSHDHCIQEMEKCNFVIFIIGRRYGSVYSGELYKSYISEILTESKGNITSPSISFMEYYVARKLGKKIFVFVDETVYNERQTYAYNIKETGTFIPAFAEKNEVFHVINYITHQKVDNWFRIYTDLFNLDELIKITFDTF